MTTATHVESFTLGADFRAFVGIPSDELAIHHVFAADSPIPHGDGRHFVVFEYHPGHYRTICGTAEFKSKDRYECVKWFIDTCAAIEAGK